MTTNNAANIRTGTSGTVLQGQGVGSDLALSTATYPATTTINQILYSSGTNTVSGLATANQGVLTTGTSGIPVVTPLATNGQIIIGSTAGAPAAAQIIGSAITVTNGSNSISLTVSGGGLTWNNTTGATQTLYANNGFIANRATQVAFTMNAVNTGDVFRIVGVGAGGWRLYPTGSQILYLGSASTTLTTGYLESTLPSDCIELVALTTTKVIVMSVIGDITVV